MDRERVWMASVGTELVTVRHFAVLEPGEDLTDNPPTERMSMTEWRERHLEFDCGLDGMPLNPRPGVGMPA